MNENNYLNSLNIAIINSNNQIFLQEFQNYFKSCEFYKNDEFKKDVNKIDVIILCIDSLFEDSLKLIRKAQDLLKPIIVISKDISEDELITLIKNDIDDIFLENNFDINSFLIKLENVVKQNRNLSNTLNNYRKLENYFDVLNKVALVYSFDKDGKITYNNEFLVELVKCHELELIDLHYSVIFHPDMPKQLVKEIEDKVQNQEVFTGKMKYIAKDSSIFFSNTTIIPQLNDKNEFEKFVSINFLSTKEENEKREYKKKLIYNLQETKRVFKVAQEKIDSLEKILSKYKGYDKKESDFRKLKEDNSLKFDQLQKNEVKISNIKKRLDQLTYGVNSKINKISLATAEMKEFTERSNKKIDKVSSEIKLRENLIKRIQEEIVEKSTKIEDLKDVLLHREEQVEQKGNSV